MTDFLKENYIHGIGLSTGVSGSVLGARSGVSIGSDLIHGPNASGEIGSMPPDVARWINRNAGYLGFDQVYSDEEIDLMEQMAGWGATFARGSIDFTASTTPKTTSIEPYTHYYAGIGPLGGSVSIPHNSPGFEVTLHTGPQLGLRLGNTTMRGSITKQGLKDLLNLNSTQEPSRNLLKAPKSHAPAPVTQPQSFGQRYGLSPSLSTEDIVSMLETKLSRPSLLKEPSAKISTPAAPTSDVITAEDAHLTGFAERHGLGWRDVWELNKEAIPNPNAVQAGTTLNLPNKQRVNKALAPDANAFMGAPVATKRRAQTQPRFNAGGLYTDYLSAGSKSTAKRGPNRNANTAGFNMDLLSTSANKAARGDYGVTLGSWSPSGGVQTGVSTQEKASARSRSKELAAVDARTAQMNAQAAQRHQAAAQAETRANQTQTAAAREEAVPLDTPNAVQRRGGVEKLGESAASATLASQNDLTSGAVGQDARSATANAHARANAANTARTRGEARHEAATRHANGKGKAKFGEKGNVLDSNGDKVGVSFDRFGRATSVGGQKVNANQTNKARNKDGSYSFDADGNGAGDAGGTVICTELYRQGLIDKHVYRADQRFGLRLLRNDPDVITGYHLWAKPVVRLMRKSPLFTQVIFKSVGEAWAREMSLREGLNGFGTVRGKLVIAVGIPACRMIGRMLTTCSTGERTLV